MAKESKPKTPSKKLPKNDNTLHVELSKELKTLIPKLDEEGLAFLIKQAQVHLYNMQVDALNQTIIRDEQRKKSSTAEKKKTEKQAAFSKVKISNSGCHILFGSQWISFTNGEITSLVKIAKGEGSELDIKGRLYAWLSRERSDVLITASIPNKFSDSLISLRTLLDENFKLKK